ncbi:MAG: hypothetical protein AcusKO_05080 [Acuticoccus sp.]
MTPTVHAGAVALGEWGVLIRGAAGAGKSALARALVGDWQARGTFAAIVADDRTALAVVHRRLIARPPSVLAGRMEVRGVGIVAVGTLSAVRINLVVDLEDTPERLPAAADRVARFDGLFVPRIVCRSRSAEHNAATLAWLLRSGTLTPQVAAAQRIPSDLPTIEGEMR